MTKTVVLQYDHYTKRARNVAVKRRVSIHRSLLQFRDSDGNWVNDWDTTPAAPVAAKVTIKAGGHDFTAIAAYDEFFQDVTPAPGWEAYVLSGLIARVAEAMAIRLAFPDEFQSVLCEEEVGALPKTPYTAQDFPDHQTPADDK